VDVKATSDQAGRHDENDLRFALEISGWQQVPERFESGLNDTLIANRLTETGPTTETGRLDADGKTVDPGRIRRIAGD
jgi:hypothetical protein